MRSLARPPEKQSKAVGALLTNATLAKVPLTVLASDQGLSALIEDFHERGLDKAVVAWGEFGRTPKINKDAGCDQLARCRWRPAGLWWISQWPSDWGN